MTIFIIFILILLSIFICWYFMVQTNALSSAMKRLESQDADHVFDEGNLVDTLMLSLDELQDAMDRKGYPIIEWSDSWSDPYRVLVTKSLLYEMWGIGDNGFNELRCRCLERHYPIGHLYSLVRSMRNLAGMEDECDELEN
jgi:hypothetical protein